MTASPIGRRCRSLWLIGALVLSPALSLGETFGARVAGSADDAKVYGSYLEPAAYDALVGYTGEYRCDYVVRFINVIVPRSAVIDSAFLYVRASESQSGAICNAAIVAEDTAAAAAFSSYADYSARRCTQSAASWAGIAPVTPDLWYRTPDISEVIGEVVAREDWSAGNAIAVFIREDNSSSGAYRRFHQYDGSSESACSLAVYHSVEQPATRNYLRRRRLRILGHAGSGDGERQINAVGQDLECAAVRRGRLVQPAVTERRIAPRWRRCL